MTRQRKVAARIDGEHALVQRQRFIAPPEVFLQVREVEQRRHESRIERQRSVQFCHGVVVASQAVRIDDAPVEVHFLRVRDATVEGLLVRLERGIEPACLALQDGKVEPGVRKVGAQRQQAPVNDFGLVKSPRALQLDRRLTDRPQFTRCRHAPASGLRW